MIEKMITKSEVIILKYIIDHKGDVSCADIWKDTKLCYLTVVKSTINLLELGFITREKLGSRKINKITKKGLEAYKVISYV